MVYNREQYMQSTLEQRLEDAEVDWRVVSEQMRELGYQLYEADELPESVH